MRFKRQRGIAMFVSLTVIMLLLFLGGSLIYFMMGEYRLAENYVDATSALFLAESGVEQALYELKSELDPGGIVDHGWKEHILSESTGKRSIATLGELNTKLKTELPGGEVKDVSVKFDLPDEDEHGNKYGWVTIKAIGEYRGVKRAVEISRKANCFLGAGKLIPGYGYTLFLNKGAYFDHYGIDADFVVRGNKIYMGHSTIELGDELVDELASFWDLGYGIWGGGIDLTGITGVLEGEIYRRYYKFDPKEVFGIPLIPWWRELGKDEEEYSDKVIPVKMTEVPNLYSHDEYKEVATTIIKADDCKESYEYEAFSLGGQDYRQTRFNNVKGFYGYGNWRDLKPKWWQFWKNPTKADATRKEDCIQLNGVTYVDGDVYLEGFYTGYGVIVATGDIYVGGDLMKYGGTDEVRDSSALTLIALGNKEGRGGEVIVKPHHDKEWCRYPIYTRDLTPFVEATVYSKEGYQQDEESVFSGFINYTQNGGMVLEEMDRKDMTNDVAINEDTAANKLHESYNGRGPLETVMMFFDEDIVAWRQVSSSVLD